MKLLRQQAKTCCSKKVNLYYWSVAGRLHSLSAAWCPTNLHSASAGIDRQSWLCICLRGLQSFQSDSGLWREILHCRFLFSGRMWLLNIIMLTFHYKFGVTHKNVQTLPYKHFYFYFTAVMTVSFAQLLFVTLSWWLAPSRHLNCMWLVVCLSALALCDGIDSSLMFTVGLISNDTLTPALPFLMHISLDEYQRLIDRSMFWH